MGSNGQGKTNVLEALFLLAISKSFRSPENLDMVGFDQEFLSIAGALSKADEEQKLEVIITREPPKKTLKINGGVKKAADYIGNMTTVFFSPDEIGMIHLAPSLRRRYLDLLLSQLDRSYLTAALKYQSVNRQRNSLLRQIGQGQRPESELDFWDHELSETGFFLISKRQEMLKKISRFAAEFYPTVTREPDDLKIEYRSSINNVENSESFFELLQKNHAKDIAEGSGRLGPHRDDLRFWNNGHDMASFGSRGEWRSLVLTLKFAEIELLKEKTGEQPILLLDDVFSELDEARQKTLFNSIRDCQTFVTTTHREFLGVIEAEKQIFEVKNGELL